MSVSHYGFMSRHPPEVKRAILRYIKRRLNQVISYLKHQGTIGDDCKLRGDYDPFNEKYDFRVIIQVDQHNPNTATSEYAAIFRGYFNTEIKDEALVRLNNVLEANNEPTLDGPWSASESETDYNYTIEQMGYFYNLDPETDE